MTEREDAAPRRRSPAALLGLSALALAVFAGFVALGVWQLERRVWKLDLIARVDARIRAEPQEAPGPEAWAQVTAASDEYRRVRVTGTFLKGQDAFTQATTELGAGYWVLAPLRTRRGFTVLVNRGFIPPEKRDLAARSAGEPEGETTVTGLMRMTEPKGGFLRANDPGADLWRSRDVAAIAASRGLTEVALYFIDADATRNPGGWPRGGLTVVAFRNDHLSYALTWFALAALTLVGAAAAWRHERGTRSASRDAA